jgi:hypothetical protein
VSLFAYAEADIIGFHPTPHGVKLPVLSVTCFCGSRAPIGGEGVAAARISGDSRYGYETYHVACCVD